MLNKVLLIVCFLHTLFLNAQQKPNLGEIDSHKFYVDQLKYSKDENFQNIIKLYNAHLLAFPKDVSAQIELCKFIGNSYWDEYEEYNLKYEETEECIALLMAKYPENPKVLIYRAENLYGEDKLEVLNSAKDLIEIDKNKWSNVEIAAVNEMLGYYHSEKKWLALLHYKRAQKLNEKLDLSLPIALIYEEQGENDLAKEVLLPNLEKDTALWTMNQKANLLLKLEEPQKALELYEVIGKRDSTFIDNEEMANAMSEIGDFKIAREFLVQDTIKEWSKIESKQRLFIHDLRHSEGKVALETYRRLQNESSYDDFFGIKRLKVFFKSPFLQWKPSEMLHLFLFYGLMIVAFLLPYLWIMPVYGFGTLLKKSGISVHPKLNFNWSIKHFWLISFFYLLASIFTVFVFQYQDTLNYYFNIGNSYVEDTIDNVILAKELILFVVLMSLSTLIVLRGKKIRYVFKSNLSFRQMIGLSILFVVFNRILIKGLSFFIVFDNIASFKKVLTVQEEILALMSEYGFFTAFILVAIVVPVYEEIIFRGVILGSVEKYIGFTSANVIQAILFALVHDSIQLFPFFFVFALITGYFVKKTGGLLTGIFFHGVHNLSVLVGLYYLSKLPQVWSGLI